MNKIKELILQNKWKLLVSNYSVKDVCLSLNFSEAMHTVEHLFYDDIQDDGKQQYALKLALEMRNYFRKEWEEDWKNDVFLGGLCEMLWLYDERYHYYKSAYDKLKEPPAELLLLLSNCNSAPGIPPISHEEAEFYLMKALKKQVTCEIALKKRSLHRQKKDKPGEEYWEEIYKQLKMKNVHSNPIIPDILQT